MPPLALSVLSFAGGGVLVGGLAFVAGAIQNASFARHQTTVQGRQCKLGCVHFHFEGKPKPDGSVSWGLEPPPRPAPASGTRFSYEKRQHEVVVRHADGSVQSLAEWVKGL